jgi:hypothetical protein
MYAGLSVAAPAAAAAPAAGAGGAEAGGISALTVPAVEGGWEKGGALCGGCGGAGAELLVAAGIGAGGVAIGVELRPLLPWALDFSRRGDGVTFWAVGFRLVCEPSY